MVRVDLRTVTLTIPPQEVITRDNVPARVAAVCYFRVVDPAAAVTRDRGVRARRPRRSPRRRCARCWAAPTSTSCSPSASGSTRSCSRSSTSRPSRGASRSRRSRSRTSRSRRRCSARWPARPRPSASGARRSSTPRASSRPPRSWPAPPRSSAASRRRCSCATSRRCSRSAPDQKLDDRLPAAARPAQAVPRVRRGRRRTTTVGRPSRWLSSGASLRRQPAGPMRPSTSSASAR